MSSSQTVYKPVSRKRLKHRRKETEGEKVIKRRVEGRGYEWGLRQKIKDLVNPAYKDRLKIGGGNGV